jgi:hypothetical protein
MRKRLLTPVVVVVVVVALHWYWRNFLTYDGEVSHFENRIRREVNPVALQAWATNLLRIYSLSNEQSVPLRSSTFPPEIQRLNSRLLFGFAMPNTSEELAHVRIIWGSGMRGHWGLRVASTGFVDYGSEVWRPGVYLWRETTK